MVETISVAPFKNCCMFVVLASGWMTRLNRLNHFTRNIHVGTSKQSKLAASASSIVNDLQSQGALNRKLRETEDSNVCVRSLFLAYKEGAFMKNEV